MDYEEPEDILEESEDSDDEDNEEEQDLQDEIDQLVAEQQAASTFGALTGVFPCEY